MIRGPVLVLVMAACSAPLPTEVTPTFRVEAPELTAYVEAMALRLALSTGRSDIAVEPGGSIPVYFQEGLTSWREVGGEMVETEDCAQTLWVKYRGVYVSAEIMVDPTPPEMCAAIQVVLLHEGLHALDPEAPHVESERSVFDPAASESYIDLSALESVCEGFDCFLMRPER